MKHPKVASSMEYTDLCNGCGLCCILFVNKHLKDSNKIINFADVTKEDEDCQYLKRLSNGLTKCTIHGHHTGTKIKEGGKGEYWMCVDNMDTPYLYEDCPYNELKIAKLLRERE